MLKKDQYGGKIITVINLFIPFKFYYHSIGIFVENEKKVHFSTFRFNIIWLKSKLLKLCYFVLWRTLQLQLCQISSKSVYIWYSKFMIEANMFWWNSIWAEGPKTCFCLCANIWEFLLGECLDIRKRSDYEKTDVDFNICKNLKMTIYRDGPKMIPIPGLTRT